MINTNDRAELINSIKNAQNVIWDMGLAIDHISSQQERDALKTLNSKVGILLEEANQRCNKLI